MRPDADRAGAAIATVDEPRLIKFEGSVFEPRAPGRSARGWGPLRDGDSLGLG